jgi:hypothetical protein
LRERKGGDVVVRLPVGPPPFPHPAACGACLSFPFFLVFIFFSFEGMLFLPKIELHCEAQVAQLSNPEGLKPI